MFWKEALGAFVIAKFRERRKHPQEVEIERRRPSLKDAKTRLSTATGNLESAINRRMEKMR